MLKGKMDDVDRMIFDSLVNDLHCSFADKSSSLRELGADEVVEAVVRCIWRCNADGRTRRDDVPSSSFRLPHTPIDRFRFASKISTQIQALGIRDQVGYQALLYPNVFDSRRLFLSLFERFPKEAVEVEQKLMTPLERLKAQTGEAIAAQLRSSAWTPEFCRFYDLQRIGRLWYPTKGRRGIVFEDEEEEERRREDIWSQLGKQQRREPPKIAPKPKLPPPPQLSVELTKQQDEEAAGTSHQQEEHEQIEREEKFESDGTEISEEQIAQKRAKLAEKRRELMKIRSENDKMAEEIAHQRARFDDERLEVLVADPEGTMRKLEQYLSETDERRARLEAKYLEEREKRLAKMEELSGGRERGEENSGKMAEMEKAIRGLEERMEERRRIAQKMRKECQRMADGEKDDDTRAKYVRKIFEISAMVAKQNEEIRKTATSVQSLRREIDMLTGSLERTFIAVDRWLSKQAESNPRMQRAHKLLVRTHEQCAIVKECIEEQGQLSRQIDELGDKIGVEMQKSVDEQLERLLDDLMMIRHENAEMEKKQRQG